MLKIKQWNNIHSLTTNLDNLKLLIHETNPHILILNETWLLETDFIIIKNYHIVRNDGYGGISTLVRNN